MTKQQELIKAFTTHALIQQVNEILNNRFTSNGRTLDDNSWRTCNAYTLEEGFWKAVRDRDFGSVLTYSAMLAGRGVNVADLISNAMDAYGEQVTHLNERETTHKDTMRLQRTTIEQHEKTIASLRAKLDGKEEPEIRHAFISGAEPYRHHVVSGVALESERVPELCYSVETVCGELVETLVIQGDPAAVKDLVQAVRAEQTICTGPSGDISVTLDSLKTKEDPIIAGTVAAAVAKVYGDKRIDPKVEMAKAWHDGEYGAVVSAMAALHDAGKDPVAFIKRMKNVAVPPDNDEAVRQM